MNELLKYADWLDENIKDENFNIGHVVSQKYPNTHCGSICCAIGWLPAYTPRCEWNDNDIREYEVRLDDECDLEYNEVASKFFNIPTDDAQCLFTPCSQYEIEGWGDFPVCEYGCTVKQLTDAMRHYVEIKS